VTETELSLPVTETELSLLSLRCDRDTALYPRGGKLRVRRRRCDSDRALSPRGGGGGAFEHIQQS
jgi:hypothetical protein